MVDLVRWIGGPVGSVAGHVATLGHAMEAEDTATVSLRVRRRRARARSSPPRAPTPELPTELRVYGDRGHVRLVGEAPSSGTSRASRPRPRPTSDADVPAGTGDDRRRGARTRSATSASTATSSTAVRTGRAPVVTGEDGRERRRDHRRPPTSPSRDGRASCSREARDEGRRGAGRHHAAARACAMDGYEARDRRRDRRSTIRSTPGRSSPRATTARPSRWWSRTCCRSSRGSRHQVAGGGAASGPGSRGSISSWPGTHTHSGPALREPSDVERAIGRPDRGRRRPGVGGAARRRRGGRHRARGRDRRRTGGRTAARRRPGDRDPVRRRSTARRSRRT